MAMQMQSYRQYKKGVKKLGGKQVATHGEFATIRARLRRKYGAKKATVRTIAIEKALRQGGLTQKEINRLRGKK